MFGGSQCYLCTMGSERLNQRSTGTDAGARPFPVFPLIFKDYVPDFFKKVVLGYRGKVPSFVLPVPVDLWSQW